VSPIETDANAAVHVPSGRPASAGLGCAYRSAADGTEPELALTGRRCIPRPLIDRGLVFRFDELETALADALR
jgi:NAD dependent epimerase/dehydratase family enzyme